MDMPASELPWRNVSRAPQGNRCCEEARGTSQLQWHVSSCDACAQHLQCGHLGPQRWWLAAGTAHVHHRCRREVRLIQRRLQHAKRCDADSGRCGSPPSACTSTPAASEPNLMLATRWWQQPTSGLCCLTPLRLHAAELAVLLLCSAACSESGVKLQLPEPDT